MSLLSISFTDRVQEIKVELTALLSSYKTVFIHRAKTACLCTDLFQVQKGRALQINRESVTPKEDEIFREILQLITKLKQLFVELSENNYIKCILEKPVFYVKDQLNSFRKEFNRLTLAIQLLKTEPCPINEHQLKIDEHADINEIINRIEIVCKSPTLANDQKNKLIEKSKLYNQVLQKMEEEEEKNKQKLHELRRVLTENEITERLKKFQKYEININDYEMQRRIGSGGFAEVYLGYHKASGKVVAIKKLHSQTFDTHAFEMFTREVEIAASMNHFAVLSFAGVSLKPPFCILTDFMSGGCLFTRLHKGPMLDPTKLTITALGVACGMQYIHDKGMLHRDLKSLNILLDADDYPKICDFGMSRNRPDDLSLMTSGVGTSQWMAPEVIGSKPYDQKADVYSFGVMLWELLTKDVPFHGLKEVQVAMAVLNQDRRPLIPQSCPPKLGKLIKICWDRDPEKRPDFKTIAKAFQSGGIAFPGTNSDKVKAYIDQFMEHIQQVDKFDPKDASKESANSLAADLKSVTNADQALAKLKQIVDINPWAQHILSTEIIEKILELAKDCNETQLAFNLVLAIDPILKNNKLLKKFIELNGQQVILDLFLKFGATSMVKIIEILSTLIQEKGMIFTVDHLAKLSPFLVASELNVRKLTTNLILLIIDHSKYDDKSSLNVIVANVLANVIPEAMPLLLESTLALLKKLLELQQPFDTIIRSEGPLYAFALTTHKDTSVRLQALQIMNKMLLKSVPHPKTVALVFDSFYNLVDQNKDNSEILFESLITVGTLLKASCCFKEAVSHPDITAAFEICIKNDKKKVVLYALKLCFAFLSNDLSFHEFSTLTPVLIKSLEIPSNQIREISAYCLTITIHKQSEINNTYNTFSPYSPSDEVDTNTKNILENFIKSSLQSQSNSLIIATLRLCGVLSTSRSGVNLLKMTNSPKRIKEILVSSEDKEVIKLAIMFIASYSAISPTSKSAISCIHKFFQLMKNPDFEPFPLIAIANLTLNPVAAEQCVEHLSTLADLLSSDDKGTVGRAFTAIHRIMDTPEACKNISDINVVKKIVEKTTPFWTGQFAKFSFDIIESIASLPQIGKEAILNSTFEEFVSSHIDSIQLTDPIRPLLTRIITRVGIAV
ncbi:TKL family protein kinase [Tritrichomonas foetus]|uniref:TKL family protein kinase n=1 Tax=Tritrichomonas foetus TaxID=1144522 RepID=A0A1J4JUM5_9EUKA|nr:TKL family protein kinase [Tritrichomonas foetus]|eukprot:OHT02855.1 TKL family protein kinase [Tritrichomonas foetus]